MSKSGRWGFIEPEEDDYILMGEPLDEWSLGDLCLEAWNNNIVIDQVTIHQHHKIPLVRKKDGRLVYQSDAGFNVKVNVREMKRQVPIIPYSIRYK